MFNKERLKAQLRASSRSGAWLARRIGVTPASVCYYLSGKRTPDEEKVVAMAEHLGCSVEFFNLGSSQAPRVEREPSKLEAERLLRRLRANPSVASVNIVYWDEVVLMGESAK